MPCPGSFPSIDGGAKSQRDQQPGHDLFITGRHSRSSYLVGPNNAHHWNVRDRHIQSLMLAMHADLEDNSPAGPLYGESLGLTLRLYLIRRYSIRGSSRPRVRGGMPTARLNRMIDFINQNFAKELRLWELAELSGTSPHYFCDRFKVSTGLTPYQYVLRCRIERAKQYLRDPKLTVAGVGEAVGFAEQSHFTKVFRRIVGITPMKYRGF